MSTLFLIALGRRKYIPPAGTVAAISSPDRKKVVPKRKPTINEQRIHERLMRKCNVQKIVERVPGSGWTTVKKVAAEAGISAVTARVMLNELVAENILDVRAPGFGCKNFEYKAKSK